MSSGRHPIIDSVTANQLLRALGALQNMGNIQEEEEQDLTSRQSSTPTMHIEPFEEQETSHQRIVDFDSYMQKQKEAQAQQTRRLVTPSKTQHSLSTRRQSLQPSNRMHTPNTRKPKQTTKQDALLGEARNRKKVQPATRARDPKKDKENKTAEQNRRAEMLYRASFQSKKILSQKESKYVPIHQRANEVVKERQSKLARLQKERQIANLVKEKECTFKPTINKQAPKFHHKKAASLRSVTQPTEAVVSQLGEDYHIEHIPEPAGEPLFPEEKIEEVQATVKRYANDKFNYLLDRIH